ncbi:MAG: NAD-dependent epimerase/dehydratase family protein [Acidimicrobiia bacterium]|nr:NAD-dependent epimerase/dehydratase family protein [Acidimicrobiia bacterium]
MRRIMVTGAATWTGGRLIQRLEGQPDVEVIAVDELRPSVEFDSPMHELAIDELEFAHFFLDARPQALVHLQAVDRAAILGREKSHSRVVMGAHGLFGALQRCTTVETVVMKSDSAFYGSGPRQPSIVTESTEPRRTASAHTRSIRDIEELLAEVAGDLPDVTFTTLRFAPILGAEIGNPISRYLQLPVVPTLLGYDPRMQVIFEEDAVSAILHAVARPVPGTFNIAADGQLYLSRILRLGRRIAQPLPAPQHRAAMRALRALGNPFPGNLEDYLRNGRVMDTTLMKDSFGWRPKLTARQAVLAGYGRVRSPGTSS